MASAGSRVISPILLEAGTRGAPPRGAVQLPLDELQFGSLLSEPWQHIELCFAAIRVALSALVVDDVFSLGGQLR